MVDETDPAVVKEQLLISNKTWLELLAVHVWQNTRVMTAEYG
jgi:hypothetical protein